jgi:hypothetical protein
MRERRASDPLLRPNSLRTENGRTVATLRDPCLWAGLSQLLHKSSAGHPIGGPGGSGPVTPPRGNGKLPRACEIQFDPYNPH